MTNAFSGRAPSGPAGGASAAIRERVILLKGREENGKGEKERGRGKETDRKAQGKGRKREMEREVGKG